MKKIISVVLLCALVFNSVSITVWAEEYDSTSEAQKNESEENSEYSDFVKYMYKFTTGSSYKYLVISSNFSYMKFVSEFRSNVAELYLIEMVDRLAKKILFKMKKMVNIMIMPMGQQIITML